MFQSKFKYFVLLGLFFVMLGCSQSDGGGMDFASPAEESPSATPHKKIQLTPADGVEVNQGPTVVEDPVPPVNPNTVTADPAELNEGSQSVVTVSPTSLLPKQGDGTQDTLQGHMAEAGTAPSPSGGKHPSRQYLDVTASVTASPSNDAIAMLSIDPYKNYKVELQKCTGLMREAPDTTLTEGGTPTVTGQE